MKHSFNILLNNKFWDIYINAKHWSEVVVLVLSLIISTAIKNPTSLNTASNYTRRYIRYAVNNYSP